MIEVSSISKINFQFFLKVKKIRTNSKQTTNQTNYKELLEDSVIEKTSLSWFHDWECANKDITWTKTCANIQTLPLHEVPYFPKRLREATSCLKAKGKKKNEFKRHKCSLENSKFYFKVPQVIVKVPGPFLIKNSLSIDQSNSRTSPYLHTRPTVKGRRV